MSDRIIALSLLLLLLLGSTQSARPADILLVQDEAYLPYMGAEQFEATGIYRDILKEAGQRLERRGFQVQAVPWPRAIELVRGGGAQGLVGTYYRPDARPWIRTFSVPLYEEQVSVYCRKGVAEEDWSYPADFKGLTFGNNTNFRTPGERFFELVASGDITLLEAQTTEMNLRMLDLGRLDCYVQERLTAELEIRRNGLQNVRRVKTISSETAHIGYSSHWTGLEADSFIDDMNQVLTEMHADGTVSRIIAAYLESS